MTEKSISQLVSKNGRPIAAATSAPDCFIHDGVSPKNSSGVEWGDAFSEPRSGNAVNFYVTGDEYFRALEKAFASARESIYIIGWQVNFDVELTDGKTLFEHLEKAIEANKSLRIYVMPWLSPKVGVDTGDFETMLAIYQLNAGLAGPARAFAMPAIGQSDMKAGLAMGFSHHQKLVVVDNRIAFVGGMDLAYGRRDDGKFSLAANGRTGNELYNSCIPPIDDITSVQQTRYLTRLELLAACFDGLKGSVGTFATSAPIVPLAHVVDAANSASEALKDKSKQVDDWWDSLNILPNFIRAWKKLPGELADKAARAAYHGIDQQFNGKLEFLRSSGSANAANAASALFGWLNNASMDQLPHDLREETAELIQMFTISALTHLQKSADALPIRYANLKKLRKIVPKSGKAFSAGQPRMPWHDVHSSIEGPSVSDLARNFELRWNAIARRYEDSCQFVSANMIVRSLFSAFGSSPTTQLKLPRIAPPLSPQSQPIAGKAWVQVLRSAPLTLLKDEAKAKRSASPKSAQNNCLKAMLTAISGAQKFIYIEGQFFQSEHGLAASGKKISGPLGALTDITASNNFKRHARDLGIEGVTPEEIVKKLNWTKIGEVKKDQEFMNDLYGVLKNVAAIKASAAMGMSQLNMLNPLGQALAKRIEQAISDGLKFHVYLVLPVHPEGTLDTLNIMTQLHLTMHSLIFGVDSLVNRIRRAIIANDISKRDRIAIKQAREIVAAYKGVELAKRCPDAWQEHLTLLNLRNWATLSSRPVTEQIYVHSKLLIADDRVAVLGSSNINDRSQLGDRDSELAVIIRDDAQVRAKLDGENSVPVSAVVHDLRCRLWRKIFGLMGADNPASALAAVIDKPAAPGTWKAIQELASSNAMAYQTAFPFLPRVTGKSSSIWPTWNATEHKLSSFMPFNQLFWRPRNIREEGVTWGAKHIGHESAPIGVRGFCVALPLEWTAGENNISGMNLTMLAQTDSQDQDTSKVADAGRTHDSKLRSA
jgi:phospholipase D1/2